MNKIIAKKEKEYCCICNKLIDNYGNNAFPVKTGRCCDKCNTIIVIPARFLYNRRKNPDINYFYIL